MPRPSNYCPRCNGKGCQDCDWFGTRTTCPECRGSGRQGGDRYGFSRTWECHDCSGAGGWDADLEEDTMS